jgi:hypothetical protein
MGHNGDRTASEPFHTHVRQYCGHAGAREIRMYTSYADANGVRLRLQSEDHGWRHISGLYEIPSGWAWTVCHECPADAERVRAPRRAVGQ